MAAALTTTFTDGKIKGMSGGGAAGKGPKKSTKKMGSKMKGKC